MIGKKTGVLFVCMGNICRSPTAEGVFRAMAERAGQARHLRIDSAGTHDYHVGEPPDPRAIDTAFRRGYDLRKLRAREIAPRDFAGHIGLLLDFAPELGIREVPDPYYGGPEGFERILDLIEPASEALLAQIAARTGET